MKLKIGDPAPMFTATITDGSTANLANYLGKKLVLYFYPMDDTPGCTKQAKYQLNFPLMVDADGAIGKAYGAVGDGFLGTAMNLMGMASRITFIIDENGHIAHIIDRPNCANHAEEVLKLL